MFSITVNAWFLRFRIISFEVLFCIGMGVLRHSSVVYNLFMFKANHYSFVKVLGEVGLFFSTCGTTFFAIKLASKYSKVLKKISESALDEYVDTKVRIKCFCMCILFFGCAALELILTISAKSIIKTEQQPTNASVNGSIETDSAAPALSGIGVFFEISGVIQTLTWNYVDLFLICVSIFLASIMNRIGQKIEDASQIRKFSFKLWKSLREDYNRASRLVTMLDEVIGGYMFQSFATNLFYICFEIFHILSYGSEVIESVYVAFGFCFVIVRWLCVSLMAGKIHSAALHPAAAINNIPSDYFCPEIPRLLDQINNSNVALSGMQLFYVTRTMLLSVVVTVVTYELVLIQFDLSVKE